MKNRNFTQLWNTKLPSQRINFAKTLVAFCRKHPDYFPLNGGIVSIVDNCRSNKKDLFGHFVIFGTVELPKYVAI